MIDRLAALDREAIRRSVIDRFSAGRMADSYEALYARLLGLGEDDAAAVRGRRLVEIPARRRERDPASSGERRTSEPDLADDGSEAESDGAESADPTAATPA